MNTKMTANNPAFILKKAGELPPEGLLAKILEQKPTSFGYAFRFVEDGKPVLSSETSHDVPSLDFVMSVLNDNKDCDMLLTFGMVDKLENIQPYELMALAENEADEEVIMTFVIDADLPRYSAKDDATEHAVLSQSIIIPLLQETFVDVDGDMTKMVERMNRDTFKGNLLNTAGHYCAFAFIPLTGEPILVHNNAELGEAFDWGYASQTFGYGNSQVVDQTPVVAEPVAEAPKKRQLFKTPATAPAAPAPSAAPEPAKPEVKVTAPVAKASVPAVAGPKDVPAQQSKTAVVAKDAALQYPPADLQGKKLKNWYRPFGKVPNNWQQKPGVPVNVSDMKSLKAIADVVPIKAAPSPTPAPLTAKELDNRAAAVAVASGAVMTADNKKKAIDFIAGHLDSQSAKVLSPLEMQKLEMKVPTFTEAMGGAGLEDVFKWPHAVIHEFVTKHPNAATLLIEQFRRDYTALLTEKSVLNKDQSAEVEQIAAAVTAAEPAPAPVKRRLFKAA